MIKLNKEIDNLVKDMNINELKKQKYTGFNKENFMHKANDETFYEYLNSEILKYVKDAERIKNAIVEKDINNDRNLSGIFYKGNDILCIVPKRETMFDEMINIHEITHLIACINNSENESSILKEVIPFFNEYEYLKKIHPFYAEYYIKFRLNNAVKLASQEEINANDLSHIYAYNILEKRKNNYNIKKLNKMNARSKKLEKKLEFKGYTIF